MNSFSWSLSPRISCITLIFVLIPLFITARQSVIINEFMASNSSTLRDEDGDYSDWIEIFNSGEQSVDLNNWKLTDDATEPDKWSFKQLFLEPGQYLIIFASGKDRFDPLSELHTNFSISKEGEYLALTDDLGNLMSEIDDFQESGSDLSYNFEDGHYLISSTPTPGDENIISGINDLEAPLFSKKHGFYDSSFDLGISASTPEARIYFTTDASTPSPENGTLYSSPISITTTTVVRAIVADDEHVSSVNTASYFFTEDIIDQPENPQGYPSEWGEFYESDGVATADYGMDRELTRDVRYRDYLEDAVLSLPSMSIVTDKEHLFSHNPHPDSGGIYIFTGNYGSDPGKGWERPASVEFFNSPDGLDFQENVALELHGGASRLAEKTPKHSFRISFKRDYGSTKLNYPFFGSKSGNSFDSIVLRAGYGNTWLHRSASERRYALLIRDIWAKDTQQDMGYPAGHGRYVHLFLNGMYWGIYNPTERLDTEFAERYMGGDESEYDIIKDYGELVDGEITSWNTMVNMMKEDLSEDENYFRLTGRNSDGAENPNLQSYIDLENYIDYMIINFYGTNWDWDHHNWVAMRNRVDPGKGFKFFSWDAEHNLEDIDDNIIDIDYENRPSAFFQSLRENAHFRELFANRIQKLFYNAGALTPDANIKRLNKRASEIELAIIAESQRWGDYRRDVHTDYPSGPFELYTKEHWSDQLDYLTNEYFPQRGDVFISQLREAGLFPQYDAPVFLINSKTDRQYVVSGDTLTMTPAYGDIYYTLDGSDPYQDGKISANAIEYDTPIVLSESITVKARTFVRDEWSALSEQSFLVDGNIRNLKITEIHYHPLPGEHFSDGNYEFLELKNTGQDAISLSGLRFTDGIDFDFPDSYLDGGEFLVLASNAEQFEARYQFEPFGEFSGSLDNSGERLALSNSLGAVSFDLRYDDVSPWPESADGSGYSLVPKNVDALDDQSIPGNWSASAEINGSPGTDDLVTTSTDAGPVSIPDHISLYQNYPNPFNPSTMINFQLVAESKVSLKVFDILGREVAILVNGKKSAGLHRVTFDASGLSSGIYFYILQDGTNTRSRKMVLIK